MSVAVLDRFLELCCAETERRAQLADEKTDVLVAGAQAFRSALAHAGSHSATSDAAPATVPVTGQLAALECSPIADAAQAAAGEIPWVPTPRLADGGANVALGMIDQVRDLGELTCGLMLVGVGHAYPEHAHAPQEVYLPIAGDGLWRYGGSDHYRALDDDALVYNHPLDVHGAIAGDQPLLALYILWS